MNSHYMFQNTHSSSQYLDKVQNSLDCRQRQPDFLARHAYQPIDNRNAQETIYSEQVQPSAFYNSMIPRPDSAVQGQRTKPLTQVAEEDIAAHSAYAVPRDSQATAFIEQLSPGLEQMLPLRGSEEKTSEFNSQNCLFQQHRVLKPAKRSGSLHNLNKKRSLANRAESAQSRSKSSGKARASSQHLFGSLSKTFVNDAQVRKKVLKSQIKEIMKQCQRVET